MFKIEKADEASIELENLLKEGFEPFAVQPLPQTNFLKSKGITAKVIIWLKKKLS